MPTAQRADIAHGADRTCASFSLALEIRLLASRAPAAGFPRENGNVLAARKGFSRFFNALFRQPSLFSAVARDAFRELQCLFLSS